MRTLCAWPGCRSEWDAWLRKLIWSFGLILLVNSMSFAAFSKTTKEIYRENKGSVLLVVSNDAEGIVSTGTAFAIDSEGNFLTAAHVIEDSKEIILVNKDKESFAVVQTPWIDKDLDLAIIQVKDHHFKPIPLASYRATEVGEKLSIVSYPKGSEIGGLESTLSEGLLSSIRENFVTERDEKYSPSYDKDNPKVFKKEAYLNGFKKNCTQVSEKPTEGLKLFKCADGRLAMVDKAKEESIVYDNLDLAIRVGESVYLFENQNKTRPKTFKTVGAMLQYTTPISTGSSGGPIFNENGEVVAIVNSYLEDAQNINFGRPIDYLPAEYLKKNKLAVANFDKQHFASGDTFGEVTKKDSCSLGSIKLSESLELMKCANGEFAVVDRQNQVGTWNNFEDLIIRNFSLLQSSY